MTSTKSSPGPPVPVLLLKTRSTPGDSYHDKLTAAQLPNGRCLSPEFVPVMRHKFHDKGLSLLRNLLPKRMVSRSPDAAFGGLIFTSQRAVEAFAFAINEAKLSNQQVSPWLHLHDIPVYSVGPATTRALSAVSQNLPLQVFGEHTGNGEALAHFMLDHYNRWYKERPIKPPLLFLVGEQRRDIIPRMLMDQALPSDRRIEVVEEVVYCTGVMESFPSDFASAVTAAKLIERPLSRLPSLWVVVFSPTGCESMLHGLCMLDDACKAISSNRDNTTFIATIGPTTRDFLIDTFGFYPDVCAAQPSPEGILEGIAEFEAKIASI
ncbi:hypothetical protein NQ176_g302 [Zarea fungicola]|uniref:Uncharacterized protein n=1 Tax=Zarea fungicola TaxID=93591 RepID=A0ACC1NXV8_9HYPO|nr:hypothetical protein NQ176_g302 [Lecanicillium fungicola]